MSLKLMSEGITDGIIKRKYGRLAGNDIEDIPQLSIPLNWINVPKEAKSLAITCIDYDNYMEEGYAWLHWSVANIPASVSELPEGCSLNISCVDPRIIQGRTSWSGEMPGDSPLCRRYGGPAPIVSPHEYEFRLYALLGYMDLKDGYYHNQFRKAIQSLVIEEAVLSGVYDNV